MRWKRLRRKCGLSATVTRWKAVVPVSHSGRNDLTTAEYWDSEWTRLPIGRVSRLHYFYGRNGIFLRTLRRHAPDLRGRSILEVGGARSRFLLSLVLFENASATALDYSSVGIRQTEELFARNGCHIRAVHADFLDWDDGGERWDLVVHWGVLEHFPDPAPILARCAKLLAPGGRVIFTMPNMESIGARWWRRWSPRNWEKHILHTDDRIRDAALAGGLTVVKRFHWGPPLFRITKWEQNGLLQFVLTIAQSVAIGVGTILPCWHRGHPAISSHRGFILARAEALPER